MDTRKTNARPFTIAQAGYLIEITGSSCGVFGGGVRCRDEIESRVLCASRVARIPHSEFKVKLGEGQITDVTLGTSIDGMMKTPEGRTHEQATTRFATLLRFGRRRPGVGRLQ